MNRIALSRLSSVRTIIHHQLNGQRIPQSPSPFRLQCVIRTITTSPSIPTPRPTPSSSDTTENNFIELIDSTTTTVTPDVDQFSSQPLSSPPLADLPPGIHTSTSPPEQLAPITDNLISTEAPTTAFSRLFSWKSSSSTTPETAAETLSTTADQLTTQADIAVASSSSSFSELILTPAMTMLNGVHDVTNLPWWISIALSTILIRCALLPFTLLTMRSSATMQALQPEIALRREAVMAAAKSGDRLLANKKQAEMQTFMRDAGVAPFRVLLGPLVQFPVFISFFISIRRLATTDPTFSTGGTAWFTDLSIMDPTFVLPVVCAATLLAMTELGGDSGQKITPQMKLFMRAIGVLSVPMTYWFPSAVFCYWIPNNCFSVSLGAAMRVPITRKLLGLSIDPKTIKGTKSFIVEDNKRKVVQIVRERKLMGAGKAAATYGSPKRISGDITNIVKPVLLKSKPSKKKSKKRRAKAQTQGGS